MSDDSTEPTTRATEPRDARDEAGERTRRLQAWLEGMLSGSTPPFDSTKKWRQGLAMYDGSEETSIADKEDLAPDSTVSVADLLLEGRRRIRERRHGERPFGISEEESERRFAEMIEEFQADKASGSELTPLHLVLAARYVEGEMDLEEYHIAILRL